VIITILAMALAVAGDDIEADATAPELQAGLPPATQVDIAGEQWAALHPDLYRWHLARSVYADELAGDRRRYRDLVAVGAVELQACQVELGAERKVMAACQRRVAEWNSYADEVERRGRMAGTRDGLLVAGGVAAGFGLGVLIKGMVGFVQR